MKVATERGRRERALLIDAVRTHLAQSPWMPGMDGFDYETRDEYRDLLAKMQKAVLDEADYESLVADLIEDGLESVWAANIAHEWLAVRDQFDGDPEHIQRSVVLARLLASFLTDEWAHHLTEVLFARLAKNAERVAAATRLVADLERDGMEPEHAAYVVNLLQVFVGRTEGRIDNSHTHDMGDVMADDGVPPLLTDRLMVMLAERMRLNAEAAEAGV